MTPDSNPQPASAFQNQSMKPAHTCRDFRDVLTTDAEPDTWLVKDVVLTLGSTPGVRTYYDHP